MLQCDRLSEETQRLLCGLSIFGDIAVMTEEPNWLQMVWLLLCSRSSDIHRHIVAASLVVCDTEQDYK